MEKYGLNKRCIFKDILPHNISGFCVSPLVVVLLSLPYYKVTQLPSDDGELKTIQR